MFEHLINSKNLHQLIIYEKLGYISRDLLKDFLAVRDEREIKILTAFSESKISAKDSKSIDYKYLKIKKCTVKADVKKAFKKGTSEGSTLEEVTTDQGSRATFRRSKLH